MATFTFDGSASQTTAFNATVDRIVFDLDAIELASISEDRTSNVVTFVATSGAVLTLTGTNLAALRAEGVLVRGFDSDIVFGIGTDTVDGLTGNVLVGLGEGDQLAATVDGAAGFDGALVFGNQGGDQIFADGASVRLYGGQGGDGISIVNADTTSSSLIVGGLGIDNIRVESGALGSNEGHAGSVTVFGGNEAGDPSDEGDTVSVALASTGSALVYGNGGEDQITVAGGIPSGNGFETVGSSTVFGGQGNDRILSIAETALVYGGAGSDVIQAVAIGAGDSFTVYGGNNAGDVGDGADQISVAAFDGATGFVYGNAGDDEIQVSSPGGLVSVFGGQGNDVILGGTGDGSQIYGGLGIDRIDIGLAGVTTVNGQPVTVAGDEAVTVYGGNGNADAADGADAITVTLQTSAGDSPSPDIAVPPLVQTAVIYGNGGNDLIALDGEGAATVFGGAGDDEISLENGQYVLTGGAGEDVFDFSGAEATTDETLSAITDFDFSADSIVFAGDVDSITVGQATIATAADVADIAEANASEVQVAVITVSSGDLAGSYAVFGGQVIDITGFTGTVDADALSGALT